MKDPFRKNYHLAKKCKAEKINKEIEEYKKRTGYNAPKYLNFIADMIADGWSVKLYKGGLKRVSKYVFVRKNGYLAKIRFSNHLPIKGRELESDCDFYVGISHLQTSTTEEVREKINREYNDCIKHESTRPKVRDSYVTR